MCCPLCRGRSLHVVSFWQVPHVSHLETTEYTLLDKGLTLTWVNCYVGDKDNRYHGQYMIRSFIY